MLQRLAEDANAYVPLARRDLRLETQRFVIWMGPGLDPHFTSVQRLRLAPDGVDAAVEEVHELLVSRGRTGCTWEVASSATPANVLERLLELGMRHEERAVGMVLTEPPEPAPGDVVVRPAQTREEHEAAARIAAAAFGMSDDHLEDYLRTLEDDAPDSAPGDIVTYVAYVDGAAVARGTASFTPWGAVLYGGASRPEARGRGAYRALVRARWDDAAGRGTPALVTHAGPMSRPILVRLGFREVSTIEILLDEFGARRG